LLPVGAGLQSVYREASFVDRFDAGTSIKVECANVKVLDDVSIIIVFSWLQEVIAHDCRRLFPIQNKLLARLRILLPGVEKAPRAGLGVKSEPARSFYAASKVISFDAVRSIA
jgi:hypothetical protein